MLSVKLKDKAVNCDFLVRWYVNLHYTLLLVLFLLSGNKNILSTTNFDPVQFYKNN